MDSNDRFFAQGKLHTYEYVMYAGGRAGERGGKSTVCYVM